MKNLGIILLATLGLAGAAHAADTMGFSRKNVTVFVSDRTAGEQVYYSCDYAESVAQNILKRLGAKKIKVSCSGGIDRYQPPMPVTVTARFYALDTEGQGEHAVAAKDFKIKYSDDCTLPNELFTKLVKHFEVADVKKSRSCSVGRFARFSASGTAPHLVK